MKDSQGSDYLGVVFGYQSNRKFYVVMWRRENINYGKADYNAGIKGLQLKVNQQLSEYMRRLEVKSERTLPISILPLLTSVWVNIFVFICLLNCFP